jgi:aspartate aminotransferase-like enzyme
MTKPMIGHRSAEFRELFTSITSDLKPLFGTMQDTFVATCSGTGMLEAALINSAARRVLVTVCGAFSERWFRIAQSLGLEADKIEVPWGESVSPAALADHLVSRRGHYDAVCITHNETSTGVTNDLAALSRVVHDESPDTLVLVDAVSALGGIEVRFDDWGLDVCLASVQKGIALPPGITVFAVSAPALARAKKIPYRGYYFDFLAFKKNADEGSVPATPSIPHFYALARQLDDILRKETLEVRYQRHRTMRDVTIERTSSMARLRSDREYASNTVSTLEPLHKTPDELRAEMKKRGFTIGGGYGDWKESTFRIGHMGDISLADLNAMLDVLVSC